MAFHFGFRMRAARTALFVTATVGVLSTGAHAASYTGYADTGFGYTNKAECCEDAIVMAQDNSARDCERAGGYADFRRSSARGRCDWERRGSGSRAVYGCHATATVYCR